MTHTSANEILVQLKYCERCGGLFFRHENSHTNMCAPCALEPPDTFLRHRERPITPPPDRKPQIQAGAWYGPMTGVVQRMQGVAGGVA